MYLINKC